MSALGKDSELRRAERESCDALRVGDGDGGVELEV